MIIFLVLKDIKIIVLFSINCQLLILIISLVVKDIKIIVVVKLKKISHHKNVISTIYDHNYQQIMKEFFIYSKKI